MVQTQCSAGVMRSTALSGSGLKNYKVDAEPGYIPLKAVCKGLEAISPWILLSVRQGKSFDTLAVQWELGEIEKPAFCRTDFYSCRRRFFANLDKELKERGA